MVSKQQKTSPISINQKFDYKDIDLLTLFVTEQGKILPRRYGCNCSTTTKISKSDQTRVLALFPFVASNSV
jgi:small subunit ribosomal protein S18